MNETKFTEQLRSVGQALATGHTDKVQVPEDWVKENLEGKKSCENPTAYLRQTIGRVIEASGEGRVSICKVSVNDPASDYHGKYVYEVSIVKGIKRTTYNKAALERAVAKAKRQTAEQILKMSPTLANYAPEEYATLAKVMADFHAIIKDTFLTEEEE